MFFYSGATGAGKSTCVGDLLRFRDYLFFDKFERIIYCYPFKVDKSVFSKKMIQSYRDIYSDLEVNNNQLPPTWLH